MAARKKATKNGRAKTVAKKDRVLQRTSEVSQASQTKETRQVLKQGGGLC